MPPAKVSTPEDFIRMTKGITMATAKAVAAGNSCRQEDVIATANLSRRAIADMLRACKVGRGGDVGLARALWVAVGAARDGAGCVIGACLSPGFRKPPTTRR